MTAIQRAVVDDLGNINVHGRSGLEIVWKVKNAEGNFLDISASDLFIEIDTKVRVELTAGEDNYSRKLTLTRAQIATLPLNKPLDYALHDETPSSPATIWNGKITAYGFRTAPSGAAAVDPGAASWTGATVTVQQGESVPTVVVTYMGATGYGVPTGGTVGQYLRKNSSTEFDWAFDTITSADVSGLDAQLAALQPLNANLTTIGGLSPSNDDLLQRKAGAWINRTPAQVKADMAIGISDVASLQAALDAKQNLHANLTAFSGLSLVADSLPYANGTGTLAMATLTAAGRALLDDTDAAAQRTTLGLGTAAVQNLDSMAAMTMAGVLAFVAGTAGAPGAAVAGDLNTGIYGVSADVLGVSAGGTGRWSWSSTAYGPLADATYDLASTAARIRNGYFGTGLYIGTGTASTIPIASDSNFAPQLGNTQASGTAAIGVGIVDGVNNRRAGLFVSDTTGLWGLSHTYSGTVLPFVIITGATERFRMDVNGNFGMGVSTVASGVRLDVAGRIKLGNGVATNSSYLMVNTVSGTAAGLQLFQDGVESWIVQSPASSTSLEISASGSPRLTLTTNGVATLYNNLLFSADNSFDVGALGANRARSYYAGTSFIAPLGAVGTPSFTFTGDSNTGMWSPAADTLAWSTGGTEGARLNSSQNFGIGTTNPSCRLSVVSADANGNFADFKNAADAVLALGSTANGGRIQAYTNAYAGVASLLLNADGGNVGIGINPSTKFHVAGVSTFGGNLLPSADATYDAGAAATQVRDAYLSRALLIGGAAPAGASGIASIQSFGRSFALIGGSVLTDATDKATRIAGLHYLAAEEPMGLIYGYSSSTANSLIIGGGSSSMNAATEVSVYTAANNTTTTGTMRWYWSSAGHFAAAADNTYDIGFSASARPRSIYVGTDITAGGNMTIGAASKLSWSGRAEIYSTSSAAIRLSNAGASSGATLELQEMAAPSAPATNFVRVYAEDNGAGKTRLMALFPTGAAQQIAIEA